MQIATLVATGLVTFDTSGYRMQLDPKEVEELAKALYVRALKLLPPDIKRGFERLTAAETDATARTILGTMVQNIAVAERTNNLLCQDTGIPIYNVTIGKNVAFDGGAMTAAIRQGCERATREHPLRSSVVHPLTRKNEQTSCGVRIPIINVDFDERDETVAIEMIPKGSGSENGSFLQMLIPADGANAVKRFVIDKVIECGGRVCPPTIVGVGIGGTSDLCMHIAKVAATRPLGTTCADAEGAKIEAELSEAVNELGIGPQGLGGRATSFRVHVEVAATHITMNPVAVNIQCHSARRAVGLITPGGVSFI
jgi:fumarate hydratase subunit alpha/L(+)-tartrate dehydratase alpha subunit